MATGPDLRRQARGGAALLGARQVFLNLLRIASVAVVARELGPAEFGVAAFAIAASRFLLLFSEGGTGDYLVRYEEASDEDLAAESRAAFWFNQTVSLAQACVLVAAIPLANFVFGRSDLAGPFLVLSATFFIRQMSVVPEAMARRQFKYRALVTRDVLSGAMAAALSVILALRGAGVYAILLPQLLLEPFRLILLLTATGFRPGRHLSVRRWRPIFGFTKHLIGGEIVFLILNDSDTMLVGAVLGAEAVGIYSLAWQLASLVGRNVVSIVTNVALPTFAVAKRRGTLVDSYLRMVRLLALLVLSLQLLLSAGAWQVIEVLYGPEYSRAGAVLAVLAVFMAVRGVTSGTGPVLNVLGIPKTGLLLSIATVPPYLAAIFVGAQFGVVQVAVAVTIVRVVGGIAGLVISVDRAEGDFVAFRDSILRAILGAVAGGMALYGASLALPADLSPTVTLGVSGAAGVLVVVVAQMVINRPAVDDFRATILRR